MSSVQGLGFGFELNAPRRKSNLARALADALSLSAATIEEDSGAGTVVGSVLGVTAGSSLTLTNDAGGRFALSGVNIVAGLVSTNFQAATSHEITVRETLGSQSRDTALSIAVTPAAAGQITGVAITLSAANRIAVGARIGAFTPSYGVRDTDVSFTLSAANRAAVGSIIGAITL